jgi:tRNA-dihydrouridine synthase
VVLKLGTYTVDPPVVLAPMAGITNVAYRQLCREQGAGLFVCEMITIIFRHVSVSKAYVVRFSDRGLDVYTGAGAS